MRPNNPKTLAYRGGLTQMHASFVISLRKPKPHIVVNPPLGPTMTNLVRHAGYTNILPFTDNNAASIP